GSPTSDDREAPPLLGRPRLAVLLDDLVDLVVGEHPVAALGGCEHRGHQLGCRLEAALAQPVDDVRLTRVVRSEERRVGKGSVTGVQTCALPISAHRPAMTAKLRRYSAARAWRCSLMTWWISSSVSTRLPRLAAVNTAVTSSGVASKPRLRSQ